jgi:hypothetical protein
MVGLGGMVEPDAVQQRPGDLLGAVADGLDRGGADQVGEAADHAGGAPVQISLEVEQAAGTMVVQAQGVFEGGDQRLPLLALGGGAVGERPGGDGDEPPGDLATADAGEQPGPLHVDPGVDEGGR